MSDVDSEINVSSGLYIRGYTNMIPKKNKEFWRLKFRISNRENDACKRSVRLWIIIGVFGLPVAALFAADNHSSIEDAHVALEKWIETKKIISKEKRDLELSKHILNERIELVEREIESLRKKVDEAKDSIAEADKKRNEMLDENNKLKDVSASLQNTIDELEVKTKELVKNLPDPIRERVKPLSQRLPESSKDIKMTVAERFQNVVGILNEVYKFNRDISANSEVHTLQDGTSVEVTAVYIGIGQSYYASANGSIAGVGTLSDDGWSWEPNNEAAEQITAVIEILKNERVASFVKLPVEIK